MIQIYGHEDTCKMPLELATPLSIEREAVDDPEIRIQALEAIYLITLHVILSTCSYIFFALWYFLFWTLYICACMNISELFFRRVVERLSGASMVRGFYKLDMKRRMTHECWWPMSKLALWYKHTHSLSLPPLSLSLSLSISCFHTYPLSLTVKLPPSFGHTINPVSLTLSRTHNVCHLLDTRPSLLCACIHTL